MKGSYTVEFSLLSPLILGVLVFIVYMSLYFYNAGIMRAEAYAIALDGHKENTLEGKLVGIKNEKVSVENKGKELQVTITGSMEMPFLADGWKILAVGKSSKADTKEWIQNLRRLEKIGETWIGDDK